MTSPQRRLAVLVGLAFRRVMLAFQVMVMILPGGPKNSARVSLACSTEVRLAKARRGDRTVQRKYLTARYEPKDLILGHAMSYVPEMLGLSEAAEHLVLLPHKSLVRLGS